MSLLLGLNSGVTASGVAFSYSLTLIAGAASGGAAIDGNASGVTLTYAESLISGAASAYSQASGVTLTEALSLIAGAGQSASQASGQALGLAYSLIDGTAQGQAGATANGAVVSVAYGLLAGIASGSVAVSGGRGDDAFRSAGASRRFWDDRAAAWLQESIDRAQEAATKPLQARAGIAGSIVAETQERLLEWPAFAPQINAIQRIADRLLAPTVDYSEFARYAAEQMQAIEAARRAIRRKRDLEALLMLVD